MSQQDLTAWSGVGKNGWRDFPREEVEVWFAKVMCVWNPVDLLDIRQREGGAGILFVADLGANVHMHLGVDLKGANLCALWHDKECVMWDDRIGFCSMWPPIPTQEAADEFNARMRPLIRRNCFLLGANIEASRDERSQWVRWLHEGAHRNVA